MCTDVSRYWSAVLHKHLAVNVGDLGGRVYKWLRPLSTHLLHRWTNPILYGPLIIVINHHTANPTRHRNSHFHTPPPLLQYFI